MLVRAIARAVVLWYTTDMKNKLIFVHGFGVRKDARGLFCDIRDALAADPRFADLQSVLVDLNIVREGSDDIYLNPLSVQAKILADVIARESQDGSPVSLLCHSQGCVVASMGDVSVVKKIIFLAPPTNNDLEKTIRAFKDRPGTVINFSGQSVLARKDGSRTLVPAEYWSGRRGLEYVQQYQAVAANHDVTIILARQDETVSNENIQALLPTVATVVVEGNHNFEPPHRAELIEVIKGLL